MDNVPAEVAGYSCPFPQTTDCRSDDYLKVTYLGTDEIFREMYEYVDDVKCMSVYIHETGDYEANEASFSRMITSRQEEILETAVDLGYYSEPRQASLEDISEVVGITPGTVGEHLRKVEERVFNEMVQ